VDRIGQLTMRNLDIADSRAKLEQYAAQGQLVARHQDLVGELEPGGARAISSNPLAAQSDSDDDALDRAAIESGTD
jgi:argininosuccinate synthase